MPPWVGCKPNILHIQQFPVSQLWERAFGSQSHALVLCTLRVAFPGGVVLSLLATLPASCTARIDLQRHHSWFVASELSILPLVFLDLCMHPGQERPPCVLSWSVCLLSLCLSSSVFFFFLQQSLLAETWGREGPEVGSPPPSAELCLAVSLVGSRRD